MEYGIGLRHGASVVTLLDGGGGHAEGNGNFMPADEVLGHESPVSFHGVVSVGCSPIARLWDCFLESARRWISV